MGQQILSFMVLTGEARGRFEESLGIKEMAHKDKWEDAAEVQEALPEELLDSCPSDVKMYCRFMDRLGFEAARVLDVVRHRLGIESRVWKYYYIQIVRITGVPVMQTDEMLNLEQLTQYKPDPKDGLAQTIVFSLAMRTFGACLAIAALHKNSCVVITISTIGALLVD